MIVHSITLPDGKGFYRYVFVCHACGKEQKAVVNYVGGTFHVMPREDK